MADDKVRADKPKARRLFACILGGVLALSAIGLCALVVRSCAIGVDKIFRTETETRIYEYGASLSPENALILASRRSGFVIPREFAKKLILGFVSTASVQISCQATVNYCLDADALAGLRFEWKGRSVIVRSPKPLPMRPIIETASIRQAILDRGFAFNERAELDKLLAGLSDMVAGSADSGLDAAALETCRGSLREAALGALRGMKRMPSDVTVEWLE